MTKIILTILTILWLLVIFIFSNDTAKESDKVSNSVVDNTIYTACKIVSKKCNKKELRDRFGYPVRKLAHFTEYFILGILMIFTLRAYNINPVYVPIIICFLYACTDEIHQMFVKDRTASIIDVLIDTLGSTSSILLLFYFYFTNK